MTSSKIDRIVSNAELFEQLSAFGTQDEAHRFLGEKGVVAIGDLAEPDQHRYFAIKDAPPGTIWEDVPVPQSAVSPAQPQNHPQDTSAPKPARTGFNAPPKKITGLIDDGARINPDVQRALIQFYPESAQWVKVDGIMGPNTRGALNRYKADHHDDRPIDDPSFQEDLIRKGPLAGPMRATLPKGMAALEEEIERFVKSAVSL